MGQAKRRKQQLGDAYGQPPELLWHYTRATCIQKVAAEGLKSTFKSDGIVWFTKSNVIDPTSSIALTLRQYTQTLGGEMAAELLGATAVPWRIGVPSDLTEWFPDAVKTRSELLDFVNNLKGANVRNWYVSGELEADQLKVFQRFDGRRWFDASPAEAPESVDGLHRCESATREETEAMAHEHIRKTCQKVMTLTTGQMVFV